MLDKRVNSWMELMDALYDTSAAQHGRYRSEYVYRGVGDHRFRLASSLVRLGGEYKNVEKPLLRSFSKYAEPGSIPDGTLWVKLSVAQHHGLPTRVVDWTLSPKVALHFATADEQRFDTDAAIWCVNVVRAREHLPSALRAVLEEEDAFLFSVEMLDFITEFEQLEELSGGAPYILFFEPPSLDARIINQGAVMSVMPRVDCLICDYLAEHRDLAHRVIIPKELKWEVRDKLDQDNVTERMLFPGLDGLSRWLKRYYGPGPKG